MQTYPNLFGTHEFHSSNLSLFPKWRGAIERYYAELKSCAASLCDREGWRALIDRMRDLDPSNQIAELNRKMNRMPSLSEELRVGKEGVIKGRYEGPTET